MATRSKLGRKTHARSSTRRSAPRRESNISVSPLATQTCATGADAVIPVSVTGEGSQTEAVIPVVETRGEKRRRRAAVVPIAVERRAAQTRRQKARTRQRQAAQQRRKEEPAYPKPWRRFASEAVSSFMDTERAALELGVEYSQTAISFLQAMLWPILGRPEAVEPVGRGKVSVRKSPAQVVRQAIASAA